MGADVAGCSTADVTTVELTSAAGDAPARRSAAVTPRMARLFASVPPEVNVTSSADAPMSAATCSRASSTARRARRPAGVALDGLPQCSVRYGHIAPATSGATGVVPL